MRRPGVFFTVLAVVCLFSSGEPEAGEAGRGPACGAYEGYNILFVSFDALQASHTGCMGYSRGTTPAIDRFAREGYLFANASAQSSWTVPSQMSYFTSLYPGQHRVVNKYSTYTDTEQVVSNLKTLSPGTVTLAEVLMDNGYSTAGFTGDAGMGGKFGFADGFEVYFEGPRFGGFDTSMPAALEWLKKNKGKKFFVFLHGYDVHGQYDPPAGFTRRYVDPGYAGPLKGGKEEEAAFREEGLEKGSITSVHLSEDDARFWRALYDEKVADADARFARFMEEFEAMGLLDRTIVVISSDHGTELLEHGRFDHGYSLYEELLHVPLIIRLPGAGGMVIRDQVRAIDLMPTVLDLIGAKVPGRVRRQMQGTSLVPLMRGGHLMLPSYSETDYRFYACKRSLRTPGGLKFIYSLDTGNVELYDLITDPGERENLAEKDRKTSYELEQQLLYWLGSMGQDINQYKRLLKSVARIREY